MGVLIIRMRRSYEYWKLLSVWPNTFCNEQITFDKVRINLLR